MSQVTETSDQGLLDVLRREGGLGIAELAEAMGVTPTAVRQRLSRLMATGLVDRQLEGRQNEKNGRGRQEKIGRGRPGHRYRLTEKGIRRAGDNYGDLATVLWEEIRAVKDPEIRRGLLHRVVSRMADGYRSEVQGNNLGEKMESLTHLMGERQIPFATEQQNELPVLKALACPYPDLAAQDRSICAMERMLFSEVLGSSLKLTQCRLDGETCCTFEAS
jgi:DeoR family transcriptional regulator, suf operon transcriptional repressor